MSSAGKDLIADSCAKPRSTTKPTFGSSRRAAPAGALHTSPRGPRLPQHPSQQQPPDGPFDLDAIEERRQSGQSASTSHHSDPSGRPEEVPNSTGARSSRGASPTSPFASITLRDGRHSRVAAGFPNSTVQPSSTAGMHAASHTRPATQHADPSLNWHSSAHLNDMHWKTHDRRSSSRSKGSATQACRSPSPMEDASPAVIHTEAEVPGRLAVKAQGSQAHSGMTSPTSLPGADTGQPVLHDAQGGRSGSSDVLANSAPNAIAELAEQSAFAEGGSAAAALSDEAVNRTANKHGRRRKRGPRPQKAGPSAFPQLPYERALHLSAASRVDEYTDALPISASDAAQQTCAQTDILADAMQQRLHLQERKAEGVPGEGQGGPQQHMSQHGGYMQRGGLERLPCRRTTRSILRGADTQTGKGLSRLS